MSVPRRERLLEWAAAGQAWIVEDDYDAEFRFGGHLLPALQGLDRLGRVLYVGTFSKVLFPALRLGYLIVPDALVEPLTTAHAVLGYRAPMPAQAILAEFIESGQFSRHLRRMRRRYAEARAVLEEATDHYLDGAMDICGVPAGLHVVGAPAPVVRRRGGRGARGGARHQRSAHLGLLQRRPWRIRDSSWYGHLDAAAIRAGVERLAMVIDRGAQHRRRRSR